MSDEKSTRDLNHTKMSPSEENVNYRTMVREKKKERKVRATIANQLYPPT